MKRCIQKFTAIFLMISSLPTLHADHDIALISSVIGSVLISYELVRARPLAPKQLQQSSEEEAAQETAQAVLEPLTLSFDSIIKHFPYACAGAGILVGGFGLQYAVLPYLEHKGPGTPPPLPMKIDDELEKLLAIKKSKPAEFDTARDAVSVKLVKEIEKKMQLLPLHIRKEQPNAVQVHQVMEKIFGPLINGEKKLCITLEVLPMYYHILDLDAFAKRLQDPHCSSADTLRDETLKELLKEALPRVSQSVINDLYTQLKKLENELSPHTH